MLDMNDSKGVKAGHETDYQRARRQRMDVKKHGITGSTPSDAARRIKDHAAAKSKALGKKIEKKAWHHKMPLLRENIDK